MAEGSNFAFKIAVKRLQIETWILSTAYTVLVTAISNGTIADPLRLSHIHDWHSSVRDDYLRSFKIDDFHAIGNDLCDQQQPKKVLFLTACEIRRIIG